MHLYYYKNKLRAEQGEIFIKVTEEELYRLILDRVNDKARFSGYNGIAVTKVEKGYAEGGLEITPSCLNPMGGVHGGVFCTLADVTAGCAATSLRLAGVTLSNTMNYLKQVKHEKIICRARVIKTGRAITVADAEIFDVSREGEETLVANGSFTFFMSPMSDSWPD